MITRVMAEREKLGILRKRKSFGKENRESRSKEREKVMNPS